ncbi:MAG: phospho-sugar mutase [Proteobacteria bacterium]|nr:phospho-sugar mutase [Pseudomonadota bacterium]
MNKTLRARIQAWIDDDPDPGAASELRALLDAGAETELCRRFRAPLSFGTAGLRARGEAGLSRMNRAVMAKVAAGVCRALASHVPRAHERGLCIGFDGRRHSRELALEATTVALGAGFVVHCFEHCVPTPVFAYAVRVLVAAGGVLLTASHNSREYSGCKIYWEGGSQLVPPWEERVAQAIDWNESVRSMPRLGRAGAKTRALWSSQARRIEDAYLEDVTQLLSHPRQTRAVRIAYTALHGVGQPWISRAFAEAGFNNLWCVPEQAKPDPDFSTLRVPNPEDPSTLSLALDLAREHAADLVLANDPDADRLAAAARNAEGEYAVLTGNDVGALLADYLLEQGPDDERRVVLSTVVSSPMLGSIAARHGVHWERTLTGFKWLAQRAQQLTAAGKRVVFAFEEALGYMASGLAWEKDGISAALLLAELADACKSRGQTLLDRMQQLQAEHGVFATAQLTVPVPGENAEECAAGIFAELRRARFSTLAGFEVKALIDVEAGVRRERGGAQTPLPLPRSPLIIVELSRRNRVIVRPSGTEPKLKVYLEVHQLVDAHSVQRTQAEAKQTLADMGAQVGAWLDRVRDSYDAG